MGTSLWASVLHAKYCRHQHPCQVELSSSASPTWKRLLNVSWEVELSMLWLVNEGSCSFWYNNWLGNGALFLKVSVNLALLFRDFIVDGKWDSNLLSQVFPTEITASILQHPIPDGRSPEEVVWMPTTSGDFSLPSAFQEVRQAHNSSGSIQKFGMLGSH